MGRLFYIDGVSGGSYNSETYVNNGGGLKYSEFYGNLPGGGTGYKTTRLVYYNSGHGDFKAAYYWSSTNVISLIAEYGSFSYGLFNFNTNINSWSNVVGSSDVSRQSITIDGVSYSYSVMSELPTMTPTLTQSNTFYSPGYPIDHYSIDDIYVNLEAAVKAVNGASSTVYPITYQNVNCELSGPSEAAVGSDVSVIVTHGDNFTVATSDIYVTNNGVSVPFTFANGTVTFTMPDPGTST